jgi:hypothetical protein
VGYAGAQGGIDAIALHISMVKNLDRAARAIFGYLGRGHCKAYNVLFLKRTGTAELDYERIGVGRLFGRGIDDDFTRLAKTDFCLI